MYGHITHGLSAQGAVNGRKERDRQAQLVADLERPSETKVARPRLHSRRSMAVPRSWWVVVSAVDGVDQRSARRIATTELSLLCNHSTR